MNLLTKLIAVLILLSVLLPLFTVFSYAKEEETNMLSAKAACLMDADSGRLLFGKNENIKLPMASTTKIMTAIIALESGIPLDYQFKIPQEAVGIEGSSIYLEKGERISFEALLYGILLCSANDASIATALIISGAVEPFVNLSAKPYLYCFICSAFEPYVAKTQPVIRKLHLPSVHNLLLKDSKLVPYRVAGSGNRH